MNAAASRGPVRPRTRGPLELVLELTIGLFFVSLFAWFIGVVIEIAGSATLWKDEGAGHARQIVEQDLGYIAAAPRSLLVDDTIGMADQILAWVRWPYERLGILRWYERAQLAPADPGGDGQVSVGRGVARATASTSRMLSRWAVISMYVAQDVLLRLSIAAFALPAFLLACLMGAVDGLVRRDKRRWGGGRESSFVYHHAKRYTAWSLTGGFGLYLSWPFGGFNPAYMVLVFTVLVAASLSTTVGAFKKYI